MKNDNVSAALTEAEYVEMMREFESASLWMSEQLGLKCNFASTSQTPSFCSASEGSVSSSRDAKR